MPIITLPDGATRTFDTPVTVAAVAAVIGSRLAKKALAGIVDGMARDTAYSIDRDSAVAIVTDRDDAGLAIIRHSCAHVLAHAIKRLYPDAQITIGPVIAYGFYYDIACDTRLNDASLSAVVDMMRAIIDEDIPIVRTHIDRDAAVRLFTDMGEHYKAEIIASIPKEETVSLYKQGDFVDLCRGPHVPRTGLIPKDGFALTHVAGAYWRGDSQNAMLQRIYGVCFADKKTLKAHMTRIAEAEKRDHRKLGKQLDLFHLQEEAPGMVFWHGNGAAVYREIEHYLYTQLALWGYKEVKTPQIVDRSLWEKSGHWDKFADEMFVTGSEGRDFAVKPMNCPCHVQIFNRDLHSYRDLPLRLAEFGACHRNEPSGALHGLMRVRHFVQDDGHIFCTPDQVQNEVAAFIEQLFAVYRCFGFTNIHIKLSTRPEKRIGSDALWDRAEAALAEALDSANLQWEIQDGEGAFYGPKIEFALQDSLERVWQCGTMQVDFFLPDRLGARYVAPDNTKQTPVMLHRAIVGSIERFIGILIEEYAGAFPTWLAPVQAYILPIAEKHGVYARAVKQKLQIQGFRAACDLRSEKIGYKIRTHAAQRIPYLLIVGDSEVSSQRVSVRAWPNRDLGVLPLDAYIDVLRTDIVQKQPLGGTVSL